jgi:hypothetical protein
VTVPSSPAPVGHLATLQLDGERTSLDGCPCRVRIPEALEPAVLAWQKALSGDLVAIFASHERVRTLLSQSPVVLAYDRKHRCHWVLSGVRGYLLWRALPADRRSPLSAVVHQTCRAEDLTRAVAQELFFAPLTLLLLPTPQHAAPVAAADAHRPHRGNLMRTLLHALAYDCNGTTLAHWLELQRTADLEALGLEVHYYRPRAPARARPTLSVPRGLAPAAPGSAAGPPPPQAPAGVPCPAALTATACGGPPLTASTGPSTEPLRAAVAVRPSLRPPRARKRTPAAQAATQLPLF